MARDSKTARFAVTAAALALSGLVLAAWARWSASGTVDAAETTLTAVSQRLGALVTEAIANSRTRAETLAASPAVRGAVETDVATVRDMSRAGDLMLSPTPHEVIELFQLAHRRPASLLRDPERARTLAITRGNEVRIDEEGGALVVTVAVPVAPLSGRGPARGAVAVATRVELAPFGTALAQRGIGTELAGIGEPIALTVQRPGDGARLVVIAVPLGDAGTRGTPPRLTLRASVHTGGGAVLWAGRVLLLAAFVAAILTFFTNRKRPMPTLDDAPTARRATMWPRVRAERERFEEEHSNAPRVQMPLLPTAREKRGASDNVWSANMPTPITRLEPARESAPIVIDPRGDRLAGRYRLLQSLGRGHAAEVYLAQATLAGAPSTVALKILDEPLTPTRRAFLEAARHQMRVAHVNVVQVIDVGEGDVPYVAMEYVEGCSLEVLLRDLFARGEPLPLPQTVAVMAAVCRALDAARPLVHGALKPSNVLLGRHNVVKLGDFGAPLATTERLAPEQYTGTAADKRCDVYSAGMVLRALVAGHRNVPAALEEVVAKATRSRPRGRYSTANDMLAALARATHDEIAGAATGWLGDWVDRARRSS